MPQTRYARAYGYEMLPVLVSCLLQGTTWDLFCPACERHIYPNVIDLIARFGDAFTDDVIWRRSVCQDCGERLKVCGGYFAKWLQESGHLCRMVMPARVDRPAF
jgi:hypothetical protein